MYEYEKTLAVLRQNLQYYISIFDFPQGTHRGSVIANLPLGW